ncbi:hypothetical protein C8J57DRAFT_1250094 [Mycena rebaudengoi]|nr:hypothetical protein C8J57DRAFT_1250094 [Mycena rebaudengoi]
MNCSSGKESPEMGEERSQKMIRTSGFFVKAGTPRIEKVHFIETCTTNTVEEVGISQGLLKISTLELLRSCEDNIRVIGHPGCSFAVKLTHHFHLQRNSGAYHKQARIFWELGRRAEGRISKNSKDDENIDNIIAGLSASGRSYGEEIHAIESFAYTFTLMFVGNKTETEKISRQYTKSGRGAGQWQERVGNVHLVFVLHTSLRKDIYWGIDKHRTTQSPKDGRNPNVRYSRPAANRNGGKVWWRRTGSDIVSHQSAHEESAQWGHTYQQRTSGWVQQCNNSVEMEVRDGSGAGSSRWWLTAHASRKCRAQMIPNVMWREYLPTCPNWDAHALPAVSSTK